MRLLEDSTGFMVYDAAAKKKIRLGRGKDRASAAADFADFCRFKSLHPSRPYRRCSGLLISELFAEYLSSPDKPSKRYTVNRWKRCHELLLLHFSDRPHLPADSVTAPDLTRFQEFLAYTHHHKPQTIRHLLRVVVQLYRWGFARGLVQETAMREVTGCTLIRAARGASPGRSAAPPDHVTAVLPHLREPFRTVAVLIRETGMRPGECLSIRPCDLLTHGVHSFGGVPFDLDATGAWLYLLRSHKTSHHGIKRVIGLNATCKDYLHVLLTNRKPDSFLFASPKHPHIHYLPSTLTKQIRRACRFAGVPEWTAYQLRYLGASTIQSTHGTAAAQAMLGHVSPVMTRHYSGVDVAKIIAVAGNSGK